MYVHLFGKVRSVGHISADEYSIICCFHDAKRAIMKEALALKKEEFRIEAKKVGSEEQNVLKVDNELQESMKDYRDNKRKRLDLYVEFNHLEVVFSPSMLDYQPFKEPPTILPKQSQNERPFEPINELAFDD